MDKKDRQIKTVVWHCSREYDYRPDCMTGVLLTQEKAVQSAPQGCGIINKSLKPNKLSNSGTKGVVEISATASALA